MGRILYTLMKSPALLKLFFFHPRKCFFGVAFVLFLPLAYLFAGAFLGNSWPVVAGLAAVMAGIYTAMQLKVSPWRKLEEGEHHD